MSTRSQRGVGDDGSGGTGLPPVRSERPGKAPPRLAVHTASRLRTFFLRCADRMLPTHLALLEHAHSFAKAHILSTIAELGVADHLADGPRSAEELAAQIGCDADALHRLLRAGAVFGMVRLDGSGRFRATRLTKVLRANHPSAAAEWCRYIGAAAQQAAWTDLTGAVRSGESAFRRVHGMSMFEWFDAHPDEGRSFSAGLGGLTRAEAPAIVSGYPFPKAGVVCDVGGGQGVLLGEILKARPALRGVLVESVTVLEQARTYLCTQSLDHRVDLVEGDLFGAIDAIADIYLLKWVLHDWDDETCERIIRSIAATMPEGARLVVIEGDQAHNIVDPRFSMIDLQMLVVTEGGRERSCEQLERILTTGGLQPSSSRSTTTGLLLIEGTKPRTVDLREGTAAAATSG
jgi:hypothetical protein